MNVWIWRVLKLLLIVFSFVLLFFVLREMKTVKYQKRFEKFSLLSVRVEEKSFFDILLFHVWKMIHFFSNILNKSEVLKKYSLSYEKHILFEEKDEKTGMDYVAIKFLSAFLFIFLNMVTLIVHYNKMGMASCFLSFTFGFFLPDIYLFLRFKSNQKRIEDDLLNAIIIMNNAFKSGRTIIQAIDIVKNELDGPIRDEFKKIYMDLTYGLSVDVVFARFYDRVKLEDAKYIATSLTLLNRTGGNIVHIFSQIETSFFDKKKLQQEMKSLTSASVFVFRVLTVLPILFSLLILALNPTYFQPFFETPFGFLSFLFIILLYVLYIWSIKKVLQVKF